MTSISALIDQCYEPPISFAERYQTLMVADVQFHQFRSNISGMHEKNKMVFFLVRKNFIL